MKRRRSGTVQLLRSYCCSPKVGGSRIAITYAAPQRQSDFQLANWMATVYREHQTSTLSSGVQRPGHSTAPVLSGTSLPSSAGCDIARMPLGNGIPMPRPRGTNCTNALGNGFQKRMAAPRTFLRDAAKLTHKRVRHRRLLRVAQNPPEWARQTRVPKENCLTHWKAASGIQPRSVHRWGVRGTA